MDFEAIGEREDLEHAEQGRLGGSDFFSFLDQMYFTLWRGGRDGIGGERGGRDGIGGERGGRDGVSG